MDTNKKIFSEVIKRQMAILGPQITLDRVKNVPGLQVDQNGDIVGITGDPQIMLQQLINQFVELSGLIVKKTMESILSDHPNDMVVIGQAPVIQMGYGISSPTPVPATTPQDNLNTSLSPSNTAIGNSVDNGQKNTNNNIVTENPDMTNANPDLIGANRDIEDLNKALNQ